MLCGGATTATYVHQECVFITIQYIELEVAHDTHDIISTIIIIDNSIHSKLEVLVALNIQLSPLKSNSLDSKFCLCRNVLLSPAEILYKILFSKSNSHYTNFHITRCFNTWPSLSTSKTSGQKQQTLSLKRKIKLVDALEKQPAGKKQVIRVRKLV